MISERMVIFSAPRTGSNWLCTILDSHPEILCHHEIFNPEAIHYSLAFRGGQLDLGTVKERDRRPKEVLRRVWQETFGYRVVGFKLCRGQNPTIFENVLADPGVKAILILRRNRLKTFVSEKVAEVTGEWESYPGMPIGQRRVPVEVDIDTLRAHIETNRRYYDGLRTALGKARKTWLELTYEELPYHEERRRALEFLGVSDHELTEATRKQNPRDLREVISNFDELALRLRGSDLEGELLSRDL